MVGLAQVNLWTRFGETERAHKTLTKMMTDVSLHDFEEDSKAYVLAASREAWAMASMFCGGVSRPTQQPLLRMKPG